MNEKNKYLLFQRNTRISINLITWTILKHILLLNVVLNFITCRNSNSAPKVSNFAKISSDSNCTNPKDFKCPGTNKCISSFQICDGSNDCADKSDEINCECKMPFINLKFIFVKLKSVLQKRVQQNFQQRNFKSIFYQKFHQEHKRFLLL